MGSTGQLGLGVILAMLYLTAIGAQQSQIAIGLIGLSACLAIVWPAAGLAMFALVMPLRETEILVPVRFNAILSSAIALGCVLHLPIDRISIRAHPGVVLLVGYVGLSGLSLAAVIIPPSVTGHAPTWAPSALNTLLHLTTGVALFLSASYLFRLMSPRAIVSLALAGTTIAALLAVGDSLNVLPFPSLTLGLLEKTGRLRASGAFSDPNFFGLYMATAAVFVCGIVAVARWRLNLLLIPLAILFFACVALSFSRGAYIAAAAGVVVLVGLRSRMAAVILVLGGVLLALTLYPAFLEARQGASLSTADRYAILLSQDTRARVAEAGVAMLIAFPVFGVGFGLFQIVSPAYIPGGTTDSTYSHNQYLNILAEQGLIGAVIVAGIVLALVFALVRSKGPLRLAAMAMGATFLVGSLFLHSLTVFQGCSLLWLVMAAALAPLGAWSTRVSEA